MHWKAHIGPLKCPRLELPHGRDPLMGLVPKNNGWFHVEVFIHVNLMLFMRYSCLHSRGGLPTINMVAYWWVLVLAIIYPHSQYSNFSLAYVIASIVRNLCNIILHKWCRIPKSYLESVDASEGYWGWWDPYWNYNSYIKRCMSDLAYDIILCLQEPNHKIACMVILHIFWSFYTSKDFLINEMKSRKISQNTCL